MKRKCHTSSAYRLRAKRTFSRVILFSLQEALAEQPSGKKVEEEPKETVANIAVEE